MASLYDFSARANGGETVRLADYRGKVALIVNTASKCGFTPQYEGLEALQRQFAPAGFTVLGFPCNQFGGQEPGSDEEIGSFCRTSFDIGFPLFAKIDVNGPSAHPLYQFLKSRKPGWLGQNIRWNFTKFLIGRHGDVLARFAPIRKPASLVPAIEQALSAVV